MPVVSVFVGVDSGVAGGPCAVLARLPALPFLCIFCTGAEANIAFGLSEAQRRVRTQPGEKGRQQAVSKRSPKTELREVPVWMHCTDSESSLPIESCLILFVFS